MTTPAGGISAFAVEDPSNPENRGTGMSITPYSAGGIQCCYQVPEEWHQGMTINIIVRYPLEGDTTDERSANLAKRQAEGTVKHTITVTIPEYETPARGTLWVQFLPEKQAKVLVSDLDPPHEDFPGEVKGWPEPSDEYRIKLIAEKIRESSERLSRSKQSLTKIQQDDPEKLEQFWQIYNDIPPENFSDYQNSEDPKFKAFLIERLKERIRADERSIRQLMELKPRPLRLQK